MLYIMEVAIEAATDAEADKKADRIAKGRDYNMYGLPGYVSGGKMPHAHPGANPGDDTIPNTWEPEEHKLTNPVVVAYTPTSYSPDTSGADTSSDTSGLT